MRMCVSRSLAQTLDIGQGGASIPLFLVPSAARSVARRLSKKQTGRIRKYASAMTSESLIQTAMLDRNSQSYQSSISSSSPRRNPEVWAKILDWYLPHELRLSNRKPTFNHSSLRPIQSLPRLLFAARTAKPLRLDLLTHLGVDQGRWEAVQWLVKAMLQQSSKSTTSLLEEKTKLISDMPWLTARKRLRLITRSPIWAERANLPAKSDLSLDELTSMMISENRQVPDYMRREGIGQIWQSIASMILQAADRAEEDETFDLIMFNVHRILAYLHHINVLPETIYNYKAADDQSVVQRPPTLSSFSSRIMTILSDAEWKAYEMSSTVSLSESTKTGNIFGFPPSGLRPSIGKLDLEVWLDLVLWSCVEGGWITEGAWIVNEMMRRKGDQRWSAVNWHALHKPCVESDTWSRVKSEIARSRINQMGRGISIVGRLGGPDLVRIPPRTVSSEVVVALIDGLVNTTKRTVDLRSNGPAEIIQYLKACKSLLERKHFALDTNSWSAILLRLIESEGIHPETEPRVLEFLINLAPSYLKEIDPSNIDESPGSSAPGYIADQSGFNVGLLHENLNTFSNRGDVQGALRTFRKLQALVDANRDKTIRALTLDLSHQNPAEDDTELTLSGLDAISGVHLDIPVHVLAAFLDLVTDAKLFDFGRWLLRNDEIDGPIIMPEMYSNSSLQPPLLRFALATSDADLLDKVTKSLKRPLRADVLKTLLHCQVAFQKWESVEELLAYIRGTKNRGTNFQGTKFQGTKFEETKKVYWNAVDAMALARAVLRTEHDIKVGRMDKAHLKSGAYALLQNLLTGKYNTTNDASRLPDLRQIQLMNQLSLIFLTVPGSLSELATTLREPSKMSARHFISSRAFNMLLEGVVENYGSIAGRRLWHQWCRVVSPNTYQKLSQHPQDDRRVVVPNLNMLRTILRPVLRARSSAGDKVSLSVKEPFYRAEEQSLMNQMCMQGENHINENSSVAGTGDPAKPNLKEEHMIYKWGVSVYRRFGLTDKEIDLEISGTLSRQGSDHYT